MKFILSLSLLLSISVHALENNAQTNSDLHNSVSGSKQQREKLKGEQADATHKIQDLTQLIASYEKKIDSLYDESRMWGTKAEKLAEEGKRPFPVQYKLQAVIGDGLYVGFSQYNLGQFVLRDPKKLIDNPRSTYYTSYVVFSGTTQISVNGFPKDVYQYDYAGRGSDPFNNWITNYADTYTEYNDNQEQAKRQISALRAKQEEAEKELSDYSKLASKE